MSESKFSEIENPKQFLPLAEKAVELAKRKGADFADAAISLGREIAVTVEKSSIKSSEANWGKGFSIRVFVNGGMGFASTNGLDGEQLDRLVEKAVELARVASVDPDFVAIPAPEIAERVPVVFDPAVLSLGPDEAIRWACENIREAQDAYKDVILSGDVAVSVSASVLASSTGVALDRRSTSVHSGFFSVVKGEGTVGSFADHSSARFLSDFHPTGLGGLVTRRAMAYRGAKKVNTGRTTLVLGPMSAYGLFAGLVHAANAESIQRKRSLLADKLGDTIGPEFLSITDNGIIDGGLASGAYDGEGAVKRVVTVFDHGRFNCQLQNSYTAYKAGVPNTGHGSRTRSISHSNLEIALGGRTAAELIAEVEDGIYLELGGLDPDMASGDISTNLDFAFRIEKGELTCPVSNTMVAGCLQDILMNIDAISSDYRHEPGNKMPTIRIRNVQISSGGE
jgi:PmbA protein